MACVAIRVPSLRAHVSPLGAPPCSCAARQPAGVLALLHAVRVRLYAALRAAMGPHAVLIRPSIQAHARRFLQGTRMPHPFAARAAARASVALPAGGPQGKSPFAPPDPW